MRNTEIILNALGLLGYGQESCQASVLIFFDAYQQRVEYISNFLAIFGLALSNVQAQDQLVSVFDRFNHKNWQEIDQYSFQEGEYYCFLRIKVFLLHLADEHDADESMEWLNIFQEKYLTYLLKS
ncbi:hypothetical protein KTJ34_07740 [Acinetobacter courvalinii]|uniref:hypothetical protein n=1 Tax=Acinetobacter courvalinii TaxID=280147 RepID=UPI0021CF3444|nr:hypothetical protein [Acinetobacter courvalinii]MCU4577316.1 hypothetical protein [Acinetobacter courvalinii]